MIILVVFCVILFCMMLTYYLIFNKELLSPSFICTAMYLLSCFLMIFYCEEWGVELSIKTIAAILLALLSVGLGELLGTRVVISKEKDLVGSIRKVCAPPGDEDQKNGIFVSKNAVAVCFVFEVITAILYYKEIVKIAVSSAYAQSLYGQAYTFLMQVRWARTLEGAEVAYYVQHMFSLCGAIAHVFVYVLLYNHMKASNQTTGTRKGSGGRREKHPFMWTTVILYIVMSFMTTGRALMLNFFIYMVILWMILDAKQKHWRFNNNLKTIIKAAAVIAIAILLFYLAGMLTKKTFSYDNFLDNFANYFSSSIYAFNEYMKNPQDFQSATKFFGIHTLSGIYSMLRTLKFSIPTSVVALEYIYCGDYLTNIYTPLRRYIQDFGWLGMSLIMFFIGYFYKRLIWANKKESNGGLLAIFTGYFIFPLIFISIEERVFMDVILTRSVYMIVYLTLIYQWIVNKRFFSKKLRFRFRQKGQKKYAKI